MKRKNATVDVCGVMLTPRSAQKVSHINRPRGQNVRVFFKPGMRVVLTQSFDVDTGKPCIDQYTHLPDMGEWRRLDVAKLGPLAPVMQPVAYSRVTAHCFIVVRVRGDRVRVRGDRSNSRAPTDAEIEAAISAVNLGLCYCEHCRSNFDPDHENFNHDSVPPTIMRTFPNGRVEALVAANYLIRYHVALANGLVIVPDEAETKRRAKLGITEDADEAIDRILSGALHEPTAVTPEVTPATTPIPVEESAPVIPALPALPDVTPAPLLPAPPLYAGCPHGIVPELCLECGRQLRVERVGGGGVRLMRNGAVFALTHDEIRQVFDALLGGAP